jgi:glycine hydroxymethyltransferase
MVTSGVRLGTAAVTSRGMLEADMVQIATFIDDVIKNKTNEDKLKQIKSSVKEFAGKFALYDGPLGK